MPLLLGYEHGSVDDKTASALDDIIAPLQVWAGQIEGINAAERLDTITNQTVKVGFGGIWFTDTPPDGYLLCDGSEISRTTYANLFAVLGTTWGSASSTSFTLPDLRQRFPLGKGASGTGSVIGQTGGDIDHTHSGNAHVHGAGSYEVASHSHDGFTSVEDVLEDVQSGGGQLVAAANHIHQIDGSGALEVDGTSGSGGGGDTGSANPPYATVHFLVKY